MRRRLWAALAIVLIAGTAGSVPSQAATTDPMLKLQWSLRTIGFDPTTPFRGAGVTVAVVDTGVQVDHEDLAGAVAASVDCIGAAGDPEACQTAEGDPDGHGTHVAGIVAARASNGMGIAGVAPDVRLLSARVLSRGCEDAAIGGTVCHALGDSADVEAGIRWAVANGADVINLSVADDAAARAATGSPLAGAIEEAWQAGVVVVAAAGNDLDVAMGAGYEDVPAIVVAATGPGDEKPAYSNSVGAARWGMAAPGGEDDGACPSHAVLSTWVREQAPNEDYACMDGTSMAAPHVTGAAAALLSAGLSPAQAVEQLLRTADDLGEEGHDSIYGAGRLNLAAALATPAPPVVAAGGEAAAAPPAAPASSPAPAAAPPAGDAGPALAARPPPSADVVTPRTAPAPARPVPAPDRPRMPVPGLPAWLVVVALAAVVANAAGVVAQRRRASTTRTA